jgi:hypothetical protein
MRDAVAAKNQELGDITEAELVAEAPENGVEDDVGGMLQVIEGSAGAFVEASTAGATAVPGGLLLARAAIAVRARPFTSSVLQPVCPRFTTA